MSLKLTSDHIHVAPIVEETTRGGIFLPESVRDEHNSGPKLFRVLAVGPGRLSRSGDRIPMECSPGDRILAHSYTDGPIGLEDGTKIIRQEQVVLVFPGGA